MPDSMWSLAAAAAEAEAAQAAAVAAAAEAAAAEARARAARLRRDSEVDQYPAADHGPGGDDAHDPATTDAQQGRAIRFRKSAAAVAAVAICASLAATAYMTVQHRQVESENERAAEFAA